MSRSGLIALIIIAVLTVAGGVYWYLEFVPLSDLNSKKTTEAVPQPEAGTPMAAAPPTPVVVEARPTEEGPQEEIQREPLLPVEPVAEEAVGTRKEADPIFEESPLEETIGDEVEVIIIPVSELEDLFGSEYFALSEPLPIDLSVFGPKAEGREEVDHDTDPVQEFDAFEAVEIESEEMGFIAIEPFESEEEAVEIEPEEEGFIAIEPFESEEEAVEIEPEEVEHIATEPFESEEETVDSVPEERAVAAAPPADTEPKAQATELDRGEAIPTVRAQSEIRENNWLVGAKISILHLDLPSLDSAGFGLEVDFMRRQGDLFSWGGTAAVAHGAEAWQLDLLASARWTPAVNAKLSFPLTISLGPSVHFTPDASFAVAAQASAGISYSLIQNLSLFYEAGVAARYVVGSRFSADLKPIKVGFSYSF